MGDAHAKWEMGQDGNHSFCMHLGASVTLYSPTSHLGPSKTGLRSTYRPPRLPTGRPGASMSIAISVPSHAGMGGTLHHNPGTRASNV